MSADLIAARLLDDMQARCDAATEGPWSAADEHADIGESPSWCVSQMRPGFESMSEVGGYVGDIADLADLRTDAEFIAAARQDLPRLIAAVRAVLDRACMEQDDAEVAMTYAAEVNDGLMLASQQARQQAWADAARAVTTALEETR